MWKIIKNLWLGCALIAAASALLLYSDLDSRESEDDDAHAAIKRIAILQHASQAVLDDGREGMLAGLRARGWIQGENLEVKLFNAQGDMPTAHTMAAAMTSGNYDLLMSISTPSLQAVANANTNGRTKHVFGLVTDPSAVGVGISADNPLDHPPYMAGYGTMQPVERAFEIARQLNPKLKTVGVVYNSSEANAVKQIEVARVVCANMGIKLEEAMAENSTGVGEAAAALCARKVQAIFVPGDVTVIVALDALISAANDNHIPVFTVIPPNIERGALFDIGADYRSVGHQTGLLAADILNGKKPADVPIENYMPETLLINEPALKGVKGSWSIPAKLKESAQVYIDAQGKRTERKSATPENLQAEPGKQYKIAFAYYAPEESWERCQQGLIDGMAKLGFVEGKNLTITRSHAQAEMINIRPMLQNFDSTDVDVIVTFTTPVLQAATTAVEKHPVVFTYVTDPIAAGAGKSFTDHNPNLTGVGSMPPLKDTVKLTQLLLPNAKRIGTLYNSGEANSVKEVTTLKELLAEKNIELIGVTAGNSNEVIQAVQALVGRDLDAVYIPGDNTVYQAFAPVAEIIAEADLPLINSDPSAEGPVLSVGPGYYFSGAGAAPLLARVLLGEDPANIPMENVSVNNAKFNAAVAQRLGIPVSEKFKQAIGTAQAEMKAAQNDGFQNPNPSGKKWKITIISYVESPPFEEAYEGILLAMEQSNLQEGKDYEITFKSAQGDISALNGIVDNALTERADMIVALSTPGLQTAMRKTQKTPIVFGIVADPISAGAGKSNTDHQANVTGVSVALPSKEMLDILQKYFPQYKRIGTLFCPNEANSENSKKIFEAECKARGIVLETVAVNSSAELADAALALMSKSIDAVVQIPDNLSSAGFTAISAAAEKTQTPLLSMNSVTVDMGAAYAIGRDYYEAGFETGQTMLQVIAGEDTAKIPFRVSPQILTAASQKNAEELGMILPPALLQSAEKVKD
ncbi:ABC transporter substrate-binding protein [Cerasicoccus fimbriatus]|uniref:ABC transporter substrate-binding protein n=1 Tax=Cerasicoccus fimbriatus TaxID=3014554 RepID=UPI0022B4B1C8|nr:ABC transporter substrate-binding protein [Cerasicoccus sp. TK19100]